MSAFEVAVLAVALYHVEGVQVALKLVLANLVGAVDGCAYITVNGDPCNSEYTGYMIQSRFLGQCVHIRSMIQCRFLGHCVHTGHMIQCRFLGHCVHTTYMIQAPGTQRIFNLDNSRLIEDDTSVVRDSWGSGGEDKKTTED